MKYLNNPLIYKIIVVFYFVSFSIHVFPQKVRKLKDIEIDSLSMFVDSSFLRLPGYSFPVAFMVKTPNRGILYTKGLGGGDIRWSNFNVLVKGGIFSNGTIYLSNKLYPGDYIELIAICKDKPNYKFSKIIRLNYINNMHLFPLEAFQKIPGERFNFGIKLKYDNGCNETITSWGQNAKLINSLKFNFATSGGVRKNNRFTIENDFEKIERHTVFIVGYTPRTPYTSDSLGIVLDYKGYFSFYTEASGGSSGINGSDGSSGSNGSESCNGGSGQSGSNGSSGSSGNRGYNLDVLCDAYFDTIIKTELLYIEVYNPETDYIKKYLVNPDGGKINIISKGGSGGSGGDGGDGGSGGNGGSGRYITKEESDTSGVHYVTYQEQGGNGAIGGNGANGGNGGEGGDGGNIYINYTKAAEKFLSCISAETLGGSGGNGGNGGDGGSGGNGGSPGGSNGSSGSSGSAGSSGSSGRNGYIEWRLKEK